MVSSVSFAKFDSGGQTPAVSLMVTLTDEHKRQTLMDGTSAFWKDFYVNKPSGASAKMRYIRQRTGLISQVIAVVRVA